MKLRTGYLIAAGGLLVAAIVIGLATTSAKRLKQRAQAPPSRPEKELPRHARLNFGDLQLKDRDEQGNLRWQIASSGKIEFDRTKMIARGSDVRWELARVNEETMLFAAPEFVVDYPGKTVSLSKGVEASSEAEGISFKAQQVHYDMETEHLHAGGPITAQFQDYDLEAGALGFDRLASRANLVGDVTLHYRDYVVKAGKVVMDMGQRCATLTDRPRVERGEYSARAKTVEVDAANEEVRLRGDARLKRGADMSARAPQAIFGKRSQRAEMRGGVTLTGEGFTAKGRKLVVDAANTTMTLTGGVSVSTKLRW